MNAISLIRIEKGKPVRGVTFLPQQMSAELPAGTYQDCGEESIDVSELGRVYRRRAVKLEHVLSADVWYIGTAVASALRQGLI